MVPQIPENALLILAVIGGIVVSILLIGLLYFLFGLLLIVIEHILDLCLKFVYTIGGGDVDSDKTPRKPFDRIFIELRWVKQWIQWLYRELNYSTWENTSRPSRPNLSELYKNR